MNAAVSTTRPIRLGSASRGDSRRSKRRFAPPGRDLRADAHQLDRRSATTRTPPISMPLAFASQARSAIEKKKYTAKPQRQRRDDQVGAERLGLVCVAAIRSVLRSALRASVFRLGRKQRPVLVRELDHAVGVARAEGTVAVLDGLDRCAGLRIGLLVRRVVEDLLRRLLEQRESVGNFSITSAWIAHERDE